MNIGMILSAPFPPDIRVKKEAQALLSAGHQVHLLAVSRPGKDEPASTKVDGLQVQRIPSPRAGLGSLPRRLNALRFHLTFVDHYWASHIADWARRLDLHVLHVHDLPLVGTAVSVAEPLGLPVVGDMHEMKTTEFRAAHSNLTWRSRIRHAVVHNANRWERYEAQILQRCARVIVVVPEAAERLARIGIPRTKIVVVSNTEDETTFQVEQPDPDILARYPGWWLASYVGGIGPHRGIDTAIQAVPLAAAEIPNLHLLIVGAQSEAQIRDLTALAEQAGVRERVEILGWQPASTVSSFIQASAVCLVPHHDSEHTQTTVPHKLFQYMMVGRPVVVSSVLPLKRIVEDTRAGLVFDAGDPASLARTWVRLYRDPALHKRLGQNGWQAARGPYAWRHDAAQLVQLYRGVKDEAV